MGRYAPEEKWEILCRYWLDPTSVGDLGMNRFGSHPVLSVWNTCAEWGGKTACANLLLRKLGSPSRASAAEGLSAEPDPINREIAKLARQLGQDGLLQRVSGLGQVITTAGFAAPLDGEGLSPQLVDRLRAEFKAGALLRLRWTDDHGEIPSIDVLRSHKGRGFPTDAFKGKEKVLSIFCALYYGRNDVIHILDACPEHVTLVDLNAEAMDAMRLIYPNTWNYVVADRRVFLDQAREGGLTYDVIVCDPPRPLAPEIAWDLLPTIMCLCSDTFITDYFHEMFDDLGAEQNDLDRLSRAVKQRTGVDVIVTDVEERNKDVCWVVMKKA
jgi:hypothetical protein